MDKIYIDGHSLTLEQVAMVAREERPVALDQAAVERINRSRDIVEQYVDREEVVYGVTTGFGRFSDVAISRDETETLQRNLIVSHACGVGDSFTRDVTRAVMLLRVNTLCRGYSGVRLETLRLLVEMLNSGVHPSIPQKGSLGASGDLAPLAHMVLVMLGEGRAEYKGEIMSGAEALKRAGLKPCTLSSKEGLALINGTQAMSAVASLTLVDALMLVKMADITAALTLEALGGIEDAFDKRIHEVRGHSGQILSAKNIKDLIEESSYTTRQGEKRVQDAYALRCTSQVHGACRDAVEYAARVVGTEINAVTDNPLIFPDSGDVLSGGNFHGEPVALAMDFLGIALSELANISERRIERLVNPQLSNDLPAFLTRKGGLNSGFMITQYAAAALVSENKVLAHPASVDSIPSSANQEDHVSMGTIAARKASEIKDNLASVLAIEYLASAQAIDLQGTGKLGRGTGPVYKMLRARIKPLEEDRIMHVDMQSALELIMSGKPVRSAEKMLMREL
ncbi:MAG: histidine ammonia-lyase [Clostridiales bacterium]|nr:histidine ammonia-lyase [Clostridiales bacterium]